MDNTEYSEIKSLSIIERRALKNSISIKMHLFLFFILTPITLSQELFIVPYIVDIDNINTPILQIIQTYFNQHYITHTYLIFIVLSHVGLFIFLSPYYKYLKTGQNIENIKKKIINPLPSILYFLIIPNISNSINLILDYKHISSIPIDSLIHLFLFKIIWQIFSFILIILFFFSINKSLRNTLGLYTFPQHQRILFAISKDFVFLILQLLGFILIILEIFNLLDHGIKNNVSEAYIDFVLLWGISTLSLCILYANVLLFCQQNINNNIKQFIYKDVKKLVNNGNLSIKSTYYEQNDLGSFISEYNRFIDHLKNDIMQINSSATVLHKENHILGQNTSELIAALTQQEINVTQMILATNHTGSTVQYLLAEVGKQSKVLENEQENLNNLIEGSNNIRETFTLITAENTLSQLSNNKAISAVEDSLEKSKLMNTHIINIHQKIKTAGIEISAIDDVLSIIKNISEQTNLLSMSAAIEAAHGDSSRKGFFLVAEEIRKLAHMSQESVNKIALRLSNITEYINDAYYISKENMYLANSSIKIGEQLKTSITQVSATSTDLFEISQQADPITINQNELIIKYQNIIKDMKNFRQHLTKELREESSSTVLMSLNFNSMIKNFKQGRSSLYHIETGVGKLSVIENHLKSILQEFTLEKTPINKQNEYNNE